MVEYPMNRTLGVVAVAEYPKNRPLGVEAEAEGESAKNRLVLVYSFLDEEPEERAKRAREREQ